MNNKGFSLVELLAVIALLAILLLMFTPSISKIINEFKSKDQINILKNSAISAAKEYVVDGGVKATDIKDGIVDIEVKTKLINNKYLENNSWYTDAHKIRVTYDTNNKKFTEYKYAS